MRGSVMWITLMGTAVLSLPHSAHCGKTGFPPLSSSRPEVVRAARSCDFRRCKLKFARSILNALATRSMINVGSGWAGEPDDRAFGRGVQDGTGCPDDHSKVIKLGSHTTPQGGRRNQILPGYRERRAQQISNDQHRTRRQKRATRPG